MPQMDAHERDRVLKQKKLSRLRGATRGTAGEHKTKETKVPIQKRVDENPKQSLKEAGGKLFCQCCHKTLQNLSGTIKIHVGSDDHKEKHLIWIERNGQRRTMRSSNFCTTTMSSTPMR